MLTNPIRSVRIDRASTFCRRLFFLGGVLLQLVLLLLLSPCMANATASDRSISAAMPYLPDSISPNRDNFSCSLINVADLPVTELLVLVDNDLVDNFCDDASLPTSFCNLQSL